MFDKIKEKLGLKTNDNSARSLETIDQLLIGDMLEMSDSYGLPANVREKAFEVTSIDSYYYDERLETEWTLMSAEKSPIFLSLDEESNYSNITLSLQLKKKDVETIFGWDKLLTILNANEGSEITLTTTDVLDGWLNEQYQCVEFNENASYIDGDHRNKNVPISQKEGFSYSKFSSMDENKFIEIERWSKNEIDVFVSLIRPISDIKDFWPKA